MLADRKQKHDCGNFLFNSQDFLLTVARCVSYLRTELSSFNTLLSMLLLSCLPSQWVLSTRVQQWKLTQSPHLHMLPHLDTFSQCCIHLHLCTLSPNPVSVKSSQTGQMRCELGGGQSSLGSCTQMHIYVHSLSLEKVYFDISLM